MPAFKTDHQVCGAQRKPRDADGAAPYQYHAVEAIVERVKISEKFGYVWHTTGSGKTLTSFKTAQILTQSPHVHKVMFVVDRKDLDYQTIHEFNSYSRGSVDATDNTRKLVEQLGDDTRLIVTTLQKLNTAVTKNRYSNSMSGLQNKRMVFIFDECHRSQFGDTHQRIRKYFPRAQMFGFTGTPIFAENSSVNVHGKRTTKHLFHECLHKYIITDAIRDENVLKFMVDYVQTIKRKDGVEEIEVEDINRVEAMEADERVDAVTDYIIANHNRKTSSRDFTAIFCVSNIRLLMKYYERFRQKKEAGEHSLKIGTIFSYQVNEDDSDANGFIETDLPADGKGTLNPHSRDRLESFIRDYNDTFGTNFSTDSFYGYYKDIGKRVKRRELDILLVVNMFLTGFDSPTLNTIYVDKNLRHHGLIQAYSRTNRILGTRKSQGNVVCFRSLKAATDQAIELFANKDAAEEIILQPYENFVEKFILATDRLNAVAPTVGSVNELQSEEDEAEFVQAFRDLIRIKNVLSCFSEFSFDDLPMDEQQFEDYKSKYLDLYDKVKINRQKEQVSILDDIDFELELIHRDEINVGYILELLSDMQSAEPPEQERIRKAIDQILETNMQLRSKKELIERFIAEQFPLVPAGGSLRESFEDYWEKEKEKAIQTLGMKENLKLAGLRKVIDDYLFKQITPLRDEIIGMMEITPRLRERSSAAERIIDRIKAFVETFVDGVD